LARMSVFMPITSWMRMTAGRGPSCLGEARTALSFPEGAAMRASSTRSILRAE
jgi:hypothetical protein